MIHHIRLRYNIVYNIRIHFVYKPVIRNFKKQTFIYLSPFEIFFGKEKSCTEIFRAGQDDWGEFMTVYTLLP